MHAKTHEFWSYTLNICADVDVVALQVVQLVAVPEQVRQYGSHFRQYLTVEITSEKYPEGHWFITHVN